MDIERLHKQIQFCLEIDKEKDIQRQTLVSNGQRQENDAEHAWHMAVMALVLQEYANQDVDILQVISMLLVHDLVEIYAGDTFAYDTQALQTQEEREKQAADRLFTILPDDQAIRFRQLWEDFEASQTPEAKFAHTLDNFQPCMLNAHTNGKMWKQNHVQLSQVLRRNEHTKEGSQTLWDYQYDHFIAPNVQNGNIGKDIYEEE